MRVISLPDFRGFSTILCKVLSLSIKSLTDYLNDWDNDAFQAIDLDPSNATLWSNKSLCWLLLGMAETALEDAKQSRTLRPDSVIACYREGAALHELQVCGFWSSDLISNSSPTCLSLDGDMCNCGRGFLKLQLPFMKGLILNQRTKNISAPSCSIISCPKNMASIRVDRAMLCHTLMLYSLILSFFHYQTIGMLLRRE